jgi:hypothetical protein
LLSVLQKLNEPNRDGKLAVIQSIGGGLIGYRPNVAESFGGKLRTLKERDSLGSTNLPSALSIGCRKESFKVGLYAHSHRHSQSNSKGKVPRPSDSRTVTSLNSLLVVAMVS